MIDKKQNVIQLKEDIKNACIKHGLNLTIHEGKIAFVDQDSKKIIALWTPEHTLKGE